MPYAKNLRRLQLEEQISARSGGIDGCLSGRFIRPGRASADSISMLISLAPLRENVYFCDDEVFHSNIVSAVVPVFRGQAGQRERGLIC